jgi:hypothetical protein
MGSTYETDTIEKRDEITLAVQSAIVMKSGAFGGVQVVAFGASVAQGIAHTG